MAQKHRFYTQKRSPEFGNFWNVVLSHDAENSIGKQKVHEQIEIPKDDGENIEVLNVITNGYVDLVKTRKFITEILDGKIEAK